MTQHEQPCAETIDSPAAGGMNDPAVITATLPVQGSVTVRKGKIDYICIGSEVETSILDHHSEAPALV